MGTYAADTYFEDGKTYATNAKVDISDVSDAPPAQVYNTQRYGNATYTFPDLSPGLPFILSGSTLQRPTSLTRGRAESKARPLASASLS